VTPQHAGTVSRRDQIAWAVCRFALNRIATRQYRKFVAGAIVYGIRAAARDVHTGVAAPGRQYDPPRRAR
jgi:hypothetical protein